MRFEFAIAAKYLIPRIKQLSVSIIALLSVLVISLVVWLVLVFLSVTDGLEKNWIDKLVSLNGPMRLTPTEAYYNSYYYKIDSISEKSNYRSKTIREKLESSISNPYDDSYDPEIPSYWPEKEVSSDGSLKDIVKETDHAIHSLKGVKNLTALPFEVAMSQFRLRMQRDGASLKENESFVTNVSYISSFCEDNARLASTAQNPTANDLNNLLTLLCFASTNEQEDNPGESIKLDQEVISKRFKTFFNYVTVQELKTAPSGFQIEPALLSNDSKFDALALVKQGKIDRLLISDNKQNMLSLSQDLQERGYFVEAGVLTLKNSKLFFNEKALPETTPLVLNQNIFLQATLVQDSIDNARDISDLKFLLDAKLQNNTIKGLVPLTDLLIGKAHVNVEARPDDTPFWFHKITDQDKTRYILPSDPDMGEGVLVAKSFRDNGVLLGDRGYLSYYAQTASAMQEMRTPIFVAGFYDPGIIPMGGKIIMVRPDVTTLIRASTGAQDQPLGNGYQVWFTPLSESQNIKAALQKELKDRGLLPYWSIETYQEYDFAKDLIQQLKSDKNLFTLMAVIIIIVACSNIISMLILLVNDKKKEIGILQSMGASPKSIALIFGTAGVIMGLTSSLVGTFAAYITLQNLQGLVNVLSSLQGYDAFNAAFYGERLPNEMSPSALSMVWMATIFISLLAGLIPAVKASLLKPTAILRSE